MTIDYEHMPLAKKTAAFGIGKQALPAADNTIVVRAKLHVISASENLSN